MQRKKIEIPPASTARQKTLRDKGRLAQEIIHRIAADARLGYQWDAIAARVGISPTALHRMLAAGKRRREDIDEWTAKLREFAEDATDEEILSEIGQPPAVSELCELYDACAREHANSQCEMVDVVRMDALEGRSVGSAKWLLTARFDGWTRSARPPEAQYDQSTDDDAVDLLAAKVTAFEATARALTPHADDGTGKM